MEDIAIQLLTDNGEGLVIIGGVLVDVGPVILDEFPGLECLTLGILSSWLKETSLSMAPPSTQASPSKTPTLLRRLSTHEMPPLARRSPPPPPEKGTSLSMLEGRSPLERESPAPPPLMRKRSSRLMLEKSPLSLRTSPLPPLSPPPLKEKAPWLPSMNRRSSLALLMGRSPPPSHEGTVEGGRRRHYRRKFLRC